jgi:hypothetical protein
MTTIQIAYEVPAETVAKIKSHLQHVAAHDANWNGAEFQIERGDYTCMPDDDSYDATALFYSIQRIIRGEDE